MEAQEEDYIKHIKQVLEHHEEPYSDGAWERFAAMQAPAQPRPVIAAWKWVMAAAAAITGILFATQYFNHGEKPGGPATVISPAPVIKTVPVQGDTVVSQNNTIAIAGNLGDRVTGGDNGERRNNVGGENIPSETPGNIIVAGPEITKDIKAGQPEKVQNTSPADATVKQAPDFWKPKTVPLDDKKSTVVPERPAVAFSNEKPAVREPLHNNGKWKSSLYLSPIFGSGGVTIGYGYQLGYVVNDKISISSGVAHAKLASDHEYAAPQGPSAAASMMLANSASKLSPKSAVTAPVVSTNLQGVQGSLSGIDVPLEIHYNISKKIYAGTGVSGLFVLNDNRKYTYLNSSNETMVVESNKGVVKQSSGYVQNSVSSFNQPINDNIKEKTNFMGFYNFSFGYRQKVTRKNAVAIEPFLKVPVTKAAEKTLNYTGGGVRLRVDF